MKKTTAPGVVEIAALQQRPFTCVLIGNTPLFCHRMGEKAKATLMIGGRKKTAAERAELKHDPVSEFRDSMYIDPSQGDEHTRVFMPAMAVKSAMATAALVVAGIKKTDVQRLIFFPDDLIPIYGTPKLRMDITRSADINKTPDVRTRAFFPEWATAINLRYIHPQLSETSVATLLTNAGMVVGIGDFRQEKGKGSYGTFGIGTEIPEHLLDIDAQDQAIREPVCADAETKRLMETFFAEQASRK